MTFVVGVVTQSAWIKSIGSFLFIPLMHSVSGLREPVLQPGWSLNYEMFFYLLFSLTLLVRPAWRFPMMAFILSALVGIGTMIPVTSIAAFYGNSVVLEFLAGMAIARFGVGLHWLFVPIGFALLAFGVPGHFPSRIIWGGLPAALIVAGALSTERSLPKLGVLELCGDASYALYLTHIVTIALLLFALGDRPIGDTALIILAFTSACAVGIVVHIAIERPIIAWFKQRPGAKNSPRLKALLPEQSPDLAKG